MENSLCFVIFKFIYGITLKNDYTWDKNIVQCLWNLTNKQQKYIIKTFLKCLLATFCKITKIELEIKYTTKKTVEELCNYTYNT